MKAWYAFYSACISAESDCTDSMREFVGIFNGPKQDETSDAELLFNTCTRMASIQAREDVSFEWPFAKPRISSSATTQSSGASTLSLPHHGANSVAYDRISHLLKSAPDSSPLVLYGLSRRLLNVYEPENVAQKLNESLTTLCDQMDLGSRYSQIVTGHCSSSDSPDNLTIVDRLLETTNCFPVILSKLTNLLVPAVHQKRSKTIWRVLIRLSRLQLKQGLVAQSLLLLDDIEEHVFSHCDMVDWGILFQTRVEGLLELVSFDEGSNRNSLFMDALHAIQLAIACFDRRGVIPRLTPCVHIASLLTNKLELHPLTNFYSVKASQIRTSMDCQHRFFPTDGGQEKEDIQNVYEFTGQPRLPIDRPINGNAAPTSPLGRGMQTLISWNQ